MMKRNEDFEVIVAGGGPAGACAAIELASSGASVLLIEQKKFPRPKLCGEFISPECLSHFARLGVLDEMLGAGGAEVRATAFYTQSSRSVSVPSEWFGGGGARFALGLSRAEMDARLLVRARAVGVSVLEDATATGLLTEEGRVCGVRVQTAPGETHDYTASVTVDATGRQRALVRRFEKERRGIRAERAQLVAFKAHLSGTRGAPGTCEIYFYPGGYGGLSPVEGGFGNLCFIVLARDVRRCGSDAERVMREVLMRNRRAAHTLDGARAETRWLGVSLESFGRHEPVPADGLLTIGDAASFIDPFTGSGMLMALESGELAAAEIGNWLALRRGSAMRSEREEHARLARAYRANYEARFGARLRLCGLLRRAAFAPQALAETTIMALGASERLRRTLARATRRSEASTSA